VLLLECRLEWIGRVVIGVHASLMVVLSFVVILMVMVILEARIRRCPDGVAPLHVAVHYGKGMSSSSVKCNRQVLMRGVEVWRPVARVETVAFWMVEL